MIKVLVVDDEAVIREILSDILEEEDFQVYTADRAEIVEDKLVEFQPDIILMDVNLPQKNGDEITRELKMKKIFRNIPVILMSAANGLEEKVKSSLANTYIKKPFNNKNLISTIRSFV